LVGHLLGPKTGPKVPRGGFQGHRKLGILGLARTRNQGLDWNLGFPPKFKFNGINFGGPGPGALIRLLMGRPLKEGFGFWAWINREI